MKFLILFLFCLIGGLLGWFCADAVIAIKEGETHKSWLGWLVLFLGLAYMAVGSWQMDYNWRHKKYDSTKYEIVRDTIITNHNGQIDTVATFKILEK